MRLRTPCGLPALVSILLFLGTTHARDMSFEQRVQAQEAIERVYYAHQLGAKQPFELAIPRSVLEHKVETYLRQSAALEKLWRTPVTAEALERERQRIIEGSRMPERLREIELALGNDPFLVAECFVRSILVDRLSRNFYSVDSRFHASVRTEAQGVRSALERDSSATAREDLRRADIEVERSDAREVRMGEPTSNLATRSVRLTTAEFDRWRSRLPAVVDQIGPLEESRDAFVVRVILEERPGYARAASFTVAKKSWDQWWSDASSEFDGMSVRAVATDFTQVRSPSRREDMPSATNGSFSLPDDSWDNGSLASVPAARFSGHTSVWTGTVMVIWGGGPDLASGGRYDPLTDTWTPTSTLGAPTGRGNHTAVWTGTEMIVWGGEFNDGSVHFLDTGGRYDPVTDTWTPTSVLSAPIGRSAHTAVWTGAQMILWGGDNGAPDQYLDTGGRYDPSTDSWSPTSTVGVPEPRVGHTAIWSGNEMIVWGGSVLAGGTDRVISTGSRYDPTTDSWRGTPERRAPEARSSHRAVWTGDQMLVWGGSGARGALKSGARYDPLTDTWNKTSIQDAPKSMGHTAVWTGSRMIVWGKGGREWETTGASYDPASDSWTSLSRVGAPSRRIMHTAVWTGSVMIVWGGSPSGDDSATGNTGGRYSPATDSWTPTSTGDGPLPRQRHIAVWTGNKMVVWGGFDADLTMQDLDTGGQYDPATDSWAETSTVHAPTKRERFTAVWTGDHVIIWGGSNDQSFGLDTGGSYDPLADSWGRVDLTGAPAARAEHTAVWTGTQMLVWGGRGSAPHNTGGSYDPANDRWISTSTIGAPVPVWNHTAVWTGTRMIVWGGASSNGNVNVGAQYDPASDSWTPVSTVGAPVPRSSPTSVWTGARLIVWGGFGDPPLASGGVYDPDSNAWTPTSEVGAPSARGGHTTVWTGSRMVIWGGAVDDAYNTGGRYDPTTDSWTSTSLIGAAEPRSLHTSVWTGEMMIVWGGVHALRTGGRYIVNPPDSQH